jgi:hypothetical protein
MEIRCDNRVEARGLEGHADSLNRYSRSSVGSRTTGRKKNAAYHCVDEHLVNRDIRIPFSDFKGDLIPEDETRSLGVRLKEIYVRSSIWHQGRRTCLCDDGQVLLWTTSCGLKGEFHDALDSVSSENGHLFMHLISARNRTTRRAGEKRTSGSLPLLAEMGATPLASILALGVLPDDEPVEVSALAIGEGRSHAAQDPCGTDVGVLLESLTYGETQTPELYVQNIEVRRVTGTSENLNTDRNMVWHIWSTHGAKEDSVMVSQSVEGVWRQVRAT